LCYIKDVYGAAVLRDFPQGKSLVFYAYDLDQPPGVKLASTFQAWRRKGPILNAHPLPNGIDYGNSVSPNLAQFIARSHFRAASIRRAYASTIRLETTFQHFSDRLWAGITKRIGWHTFRHTYSTLLTECGNDVKVVQELMRHAKLSTTMEIYTHWRMERKREAQSRVIDALFSRQRKEAVR